MKTSSISGGRDGDMMEPGRESGWSPQAGQRGDDKEKLSIIKNKLESIIKSGRPYFKHTTKKT